MVLPRYLPLYFGDFGDPGIFTGITGITCITGFTGIYRYLPVLTGNYPGITPVFTPVFWGFWGPRYF